MSDDRHERIADLDYTEATGFLTGKAAAMAEWAHRREKREFHKLVRRLIVRRSMRRARERDPEKARAKVRAWRAAHREHVREYDRRRRAKKRKAGKPFAFVCAHCRKPSTTTRPARFCSKRCANAFHGAHRAPRNKGLRRMTIGADIVRALAAGPLRLRDLVAATGASSSSCATKLTRMVKAGELARVGRLYGLPEAAS